MRQWKFLVETLGEDHGVTNAWRCFETIEAAVVAAKSEWPHYDYDHFYFYEIGDDGNLRCLGAAELLQWLEPIEPTPMWSRPHRWRRP